MASTLNLKNNNNSKTKLLLPACETNKQTNKQKIVRSLGTCWEATFEWMHLHQHQSSHGDHLVDDRGGTWCGCDLLSAGLLRSRMLDSWIDPISTYESALKRPTPVRSLLSLTQAYRGRSDPGQHLDGETIYSSSLLVDGSHSTDYPVGLCLIG